MAVMTLAQLITQTDLMAAQYVDLRDDLGDEAIEEPSDDTGTRGMIGDQHTTAKAYSGDDWDAFLVACKTDANKATVQEVGPDVFGERMEALQDLAADVGLDGVSTLTAFLSYHNASAAGIAANGAANTGLMAPAFGRGVYYLTEGANLDSDLVYSPAIASMATKVVGGDFTHVADVDTTKYAGAARAFVTISGLTGTGTVIVTGTARNTGSTVTGRTFTAEVTDGTATLLVPQNTHDLLVAVTSITMDEGITAGTATVSCAIPSGRTEYLA